MADAKRRYEENLASGYYGDNPPKYKFDGMDENKVVEAEAKEKGEEENKTAAAATEDAAHSEL